MSAFWAGFIFTWAGVLGIFAALALALRLLSAVDVLSARADFIAGTLAGACALGLALILAVRHFTGDQS